MSKLSRKGERGRYTSPHLTFEHGTTATECMPCQSRGRVAQPTAPLPSTQLHTIEPHGSCTPFINDFPPDYFSSPPLFLSETPMFLFRTAKVHTLPPATSSQPHTGRECGGGVVSVRWRTGAVGWCCCLALHFLRITSGEIYYIEFAGCTLPHVPTHS